MDLKTFEKKLLKDPKFRKEYNKKDLSFEVGQMLVEARIIKGITQEKLAKMIKTKQSGIARAENGNHLTSLSFLERIAKALHTHIILKFAFMDKGNIRLTYKPTNTKQEEKQITYPVTPKQYSIPNFSYKTDSMPMTYAKEY